MPTPSLFAATRAALLPAGCIRTGCVVRGEARPLARCPLTAQRRLRARAPRRYGESSEGASRTSDHFDKQEWNRAHYESEDFYDHAGSRRWNVNGPNEEELLRQARRRAQQRQAEAQASWAYRASSRPHWRTQPPPRPLVRRPPALLIVAAQLTATAGIWAWVASTWHWS